MFGIGGKKGVIGLDIGSHSIKAVELSASKKMGKGSYEVQNIGYELLPHDAIVEGTIIDASAVAETIKILFSENKFSSKNVAISISGNSVIIKKISLPSMETEELAESIIWEAKHNIPYPYEETNVDYAVLKPVETQNGRNLDILLVAAKKDKIANYSNVVIQAKKNLSAIDVDVFALYNTYEANYPDMFAEKCVAIINLGANITNMIIIDKGTPQLFRDLALGSSLFLENICKDLGLGSDDAEKLIKGIPVENIQEDQFRFILDMNIQNIIEEVEKTFTFFEAGEREGKKVEQIYVCGGLSMLKDLSKIFEEKTGIKTEIFNPFRKIIASEKLDSMYFDEMAAHFGVATGLAMREMEK